MSEAKPFCISKMEVWEAYACQCFEDRNDASGRALGGFRLVQGYEGPNFLKASEGQRRPDDLERATFFRHVFGWGGDLSPANVAAAARRRALYRRHISAAATHDPCPRKAARLSCLRAGCSGRTSPGGRLGAFPRACALGLRRRIRRHRKSGNWSSGPRLRPVLRAGAWWRA